jgi:MoxR-like ATPase
MVRPERQQLSAAPTNPRPAPLDSGFDVADLYLGTSSRTEEGQRSNLDEKLRQAYFWIVNQAIVSPHYDVEFEDGPSASYRLGDSQALLTLPSAQSYSSYVLVPLLSFATRSKCLFIGGPGRGKTASALIMGVLGGSSPRDVRRAMQHGHPQMTIADLLGSPLPSDLMNASSADDIRIAWRKWLSMPVKIIDEYNRIPTRTQSALLTVMGDGYAELFDQIFECPPASWFLTANDDSGGGTYQVIEALRDRIDVIVQAMSFNSRFLAELLDRVESGIRPEDVVPSELIFTDEEITQMVAETRSVPLSRPVLRRIEFFISHFEFAEHGAISLEYRTKDTVRLSGIDHHLVTALDSGRDRLADLGAQTTNGLSVRNMLTLLTFSKAIAWFRGGDEVQLDDVRQVLPFVLRNKLQPDAEAPFFDAAGNQPFRTDPVGWLRQLFDRSCAEYDALGLDHNDPVGDLQAQFGEGVEGLSARDVKDRLISIERVLSKIAQGGKLYGHLYDDILQLKYLHQRYSNYLRWLETQ